MNDKTLAEKVANKLGEPKDFRVGSINGEIYYAIYIGEYGGTVEWYHYFTWSTVGLAVEDARKKGWMLIVAPDSVWFQTDQFSHYGILPTEHECFKEHGYVKAILLAYLEILDE